MTEDEIRRRHRGNQPMSAEDRAWVVAEIRRRSVVYTHAQRRAMQAAADLIEHSRPRPRVAIQLIDPENEITGHSRTGSGTGTFLAASGAGAFVDEPHTEVRQYADLTPSQTERQQRTGDSEPRCVRLQNGEAMDCMAALADWVSRPYDPGPRPVLCVVCRREPEDRDEGGTGVREPRDPEPPTQPDAEVEAEIPDREDAMRKGFWTAILWTEDLTKVATGAGSTEVAALTNAVAAHARRAS